MCKNAISCTCANMQDLAFCTLHIGRNEKTGSLELYVSKIQGCKILHIFNCAISCSFDTCKILFIYISLSIPLCLRCKVQDFAQLYNLKVRDFAHLLMSKVQDAAHWRCNSLHFCTLKNAIFQNVRCSHYMTHFKKTNLVKLSCIDWGNLSTM